MRKDEGSKTGTVMNRIALFAWGVLCCNVVFIAVDSFNLKVRFCQKVRELHRQHMRERGKSAATTIPR